MSEEQEATKGYINRLVVKAIEKKKQHEQQVANKNKPKLEYVLFSQFEVLKTIPSKSGDTVIYHLAKKDAPQQQLCCKTVTADASESAREMLVAEASRLEMSQHPSVAEFVKIGHEFDRPYLLYEWTQGESLAEKMARYSSKGFRHDHIAWLVYQLAGALEYMHTRGVCHLDIKPSNILVGEDDAVKLIDFGAARYIEEHDNIIEASLKYASPAYLDSGVAEPQDDVYSLALLTGHLFLGLTLGESWHQLLLARRRPPLIPKHVWKLIRAVVTKPRRHGFTAISFAQCLAQIDTHALKSGNSAPIFTNLRNADLVLTAHRDAQSRLVNRFKFLEATLVTCILLITATYLYHYLQPAWEPLFRSAKSHGVASIKPAQTAAFLALSPWKIEYALDDMNNDVVTTAPYREAYQVQQQQLQSIYKYRARALDEQRGFASLLPPAMHDMRTQLVNLKESLRKKGTLSAAAESRITSMMARLNEMSVASQSLAISYGRDKKRLLQLLLQGDVATVDDYMKSAWKRSQAQAYYYSQILPKQLLENVYSEANSNAKRHYFSLAIAQIQVAKKLFGNTSGLNAKERELKVARGEYILFSTVTGQAVFAQQKLNAALVDLKDNAPKRFDEVKALLKRMAVEALKGSHDRQKPANGALAVQNALHDYAVSTKG